jgi:starch-binding outer membrane protein, SusD/RagB family
MMKRLINSIKLETGILALLFAGCVKLEETPMDFVSPANFYNTSSQVEASFTSSMNSLYYKWGVGYSYISTLFENDDQYFGGDLVMDDSYGNAFWKIHHQAIADINPVVAALDKNQLGASASSTEKANYMGMAKFMRAYSYFCLVRLYGEVPLILETTKTEDEITRTPIADVYTQIESDLLFAAENLPVSWSPEKIGFPARDAAKTLLAKVYITMATAPMNNTSYFIKARDMAKEVMDAGIYYLVSDINEVFAEANKYSPEIMWSFISTADDPGTSPQIYLPSSIARGWGDIHPEPAWAISYPDQPRKAAYFFLEDWDGNPYTTFDWGGPAIKKFLYEDQDDILAKRNLCNIPILRYADVLLLFAEAENMVNGGPDQAACDAVNQVINRANGYAANIADPLLTPSMTKDTFDAAVIDQRSWELCFEYDRWYDLCRKRILREKTPEAYRQNFSEDDYLYPIPQNDLQINHLLVQNPGYSTPTK